MLSLAAGPVPNAAALEDERWDLHDELLASTPATRADCSAVLNCVVQELNIICASDIDDELRERLRMVELAVRRAYAVVARAAGLDPAGIGHIV